MADDIRTYETENYIIKINRSQCIGCGTCSAIAPKTFEPDNNYITTVIPGQNDPADQILEAACSCAVSAITIIDKKTGKEIYPNPN